MRMNIVNLFSLEREVHYTVVFFSSLVVPSWLPEIRMWQVITANVDWMDRRKLGFSTGFVLNDPRGHKT